MQHIELIARADEQMVSTRQSSAALKPTLEKNRKLRDSCEETASQRCVH